MSELRSLSTQLFSELTTAGFPSKYMELDQAIRQAISDFPGLKTDLYPISFDNLLELRVALLLSDFSSLFLTAGENMTLCGPSDVGPGWPTKFAMPVEQLRSLGVLVNEGVPAIRPGLLFCNDPTDAALFHQLRPLVEAGRLMIRPRPILLGSCAETNSKGGRNFRVIDTDPNAPGDAWVSREVLRPNDSIPVESAGMSRVSYSEIGTAVLPYLDGVSFGEMAKILDDETDSLATFRRGIRETIRTAREEPESGTDVFNDVLRPATEKVQRDFQAIRDKYLPRVAVVTVGAVALSLGVATGIELFTAAGAVTSGAGAATLGLIAKEYSDYRESFSKLKELPHYLLWRIKRRVV